jgi:uncharacterized repeat protein (TIGR03803 family)
MKSKMLRTKMRAIFRNTFAIVSTVSAMAVFAHAQTYTKLVDFDGPDGLNPSYVSLVQGRDGNLYGTTSSGGMECCGTVFSITPGGELSTINCFAPPPSNNCSVGANPWGGLVLGTDGYFYGTTFGYATVFKTNSMGQLTMLYFLFQAPYYGDDPVGALVQASDGNFYGTTSEGGSYGKGTIFGITPAGTVTTLYSFCSQPNCSDGSYPYAPLIQSNNGELYGTTTLNGNSGCVGSYGCGTLFKITLDGEFTTLHTFCSEPNCADGANPYGALLQGPDGNLYGTTANGGSSHCGGGCGTIFKITPSGKLTTTYTFCTSNVCPDGANPSGGLILATDGNFYGTTQGGGDHNCQCGTVFEITPEDTLTTLHAFGFSPDGSVPMGGLLQATDGNFYGTTYYGGVNRDGTVFKLSAGLGPFVSFVRGYGRVGQTGGILGQGFTGTTSVELNGTPTNFKVVSDTYLTATVPPGATTGYVTVTTPTGVLTSNVPFHVIP